MFLTLLLAQILEAKGQTVADVIMNGIGDEHPGITVDHGPLDLDSAANRVDHAGELEEQTVADSLYDPTPVLLDFGVDQFATVRLESPKRPFLIGTHEPAITGHICGEDGGQPAFDAFRGQGGAPQPHGPIRLSARGQF